MQAPIYALPLRFRHMAFDSPPYHVSRFITARRLLFRSGFDALSTSIYGIFLRAPHISGPPILNFAALRGARRRRCRYIHQQHHFQDLRCDRLRSAALAAFIFIRSHTSRNALFTPPSASTPATKFFKHALTSLSRQKKIARFNSVILTFLLRTPCFVLRYPSASAP